MSLAFRFPLSQVPLVDVTVATIRSTLEQSKWTDQCLASLANEPVRQVLYDLDANPTELRHTRLATFDACESEFMSFVDYDDWVAPGFFREAVTYLQQHPHVGGVYSQSLVVDIRGRPLYLLHAHSEYSVDLHARSFNHVRQLMVFRRSAYEKCRARLVSTPNQFIIEKVLAFCIGVTSGWVYIPKTSYFFRLSPRGLHTQQNVLQMKHDYYVFAHDVLKHGV